jgi:hypothetical protein
LKESIEEIISRIEHLAAGWIFGGIEGGGYMRPKAGLISRMVGGIHKYI